MMKATGRIGEPPSEHLGEQRSGIHGPFTRLRRLAVVV